jgi:glycine hydroxymethyltransferase
MTDSLKTLARTDPELFATLRCELHRQKNGLELIASENFTPPAVLAALGSVLTNKYAEGYPGRRYYGGCECVDETERLAIERAKRLFGADYANVQPHSGTQANMAAYFATLEPGDAMLAMNLAHGGHLTHGSPVNFSGRLYRVVSYGVRRDTQTIDYDQVRRLAQEHRPKVIVAGASAYPRLIDFDAFGRIAAEVGALLIVDMAHIAGLVAAGQHPSPVAAADIVTTTTHKTLRGPRGGLILAKEKHARTLESRVFPGMQGGPLMHVIAAKAVALHLAAAPDFVDYQKQIVQNAARLAQALTNRGFRLVSGGTDNHLILVDLQEKGITGRDAEEALNTAGITVNKNAVPFDPQPPKTTSGIRLGVAALTTRNMGPDQMERIADLMTDALRRPDDPSHLARVREAVEELCHRFPLYPEIEYVD